MYLTKAMLEKPSVEFILMRYRDYVDKVKVSLFTPKRSFVEHV